MREVPMRQLFSTSLTVAALFLCTVFFAAPALCADGNARATPPSLDQELQAAQLAEFSLLARIDGHEDEPASKEQLDKLAKVYADISARNPKSVKALNAEGDYLWKIMRREEALEKWKLSESLDPNNAETVNNLGTYELWAQNVEKAVDYFERACKLAPDNAFYHTNAANTSYMFRHQAAEKEGTDSETILLRALEHFHRAAQIEPLNPGFARAYAETFYILKVPDWNAAIAAWKHFLEVSPEKDFAYSNLVRIHLKQGQKKEAQEDLDRIKDVKFDGLKKHFQQIIDTK